MLISLQLSFAAVFGRKSNEKCKAFFVPNVTKSMWHCFSQIMCFLAGSQVFICLSCSFCVCPLGSGLSSEVCVCDACKVRYLDKEEPNHSQILKPRRESGKLRFRHEKRALPLLILEVRKSVKARS